MQRGSGRHGAPRTAPHLKLSRNNDHTAPLAPAPPAGDDLQRQLGALPCVRPSKVFRILISRLTPECVLGLPGLVCTLGASRARGHAHTDIPVHLYGPPGVAEYLNTVFKVRARGNVTGYYHLLVLAWFRATYNF